MYEIFNTFLRLNLVHLDSKHILLVAEMPLWLYPVLRQKNYTIWYFGLSQSPGKKIPRHFENKYDQYGIFLFKLLIQKTFLPL